MKAQQPAGSPRPGIGASARCDGSRGHGHPPEHRHHVTLTSDDRDLLSGIAVMTLAIADRELAQEAFPETFPPDDHAIEAQPCGLVNSASDAEICVSPVGHRGRHRFRNLTIETTNGLAN